MLSIRASAPQDFPSRLIVQVVFLAYAAAANECDPSNGCTVCAACCSKLIGDGIVCDDCVREKCTNTPTPTPSAETCRTDPCPCAAKSHVFAAANAGCRVRMQAVECRVQSHNFLESA